MYCEKDSKMATVLYLAYNMNCTRRDLMFIEQFIDIIIIMLNIILIKVIILFYNILFCSVRPQKYNIITFNKIHIVTCFTSQW